MISKVFIRIALFPVIAVVPMMVLTVRFLPPATKNQTGIPGMSLAG